jgi:hypothetical protein
MRESAARLIFPVLLVVFLFGCRPSAPSVPRYIVTATPVDAVGGGWGVCIAVDPTDAQGVWVATRTLGMRHPHNGSKSFSSGSRSSEDIHEFQLHLRELHATTSRRHS